ncbi:MAG: YtxH domain-containing protein [Chloroflexi bacterium]|nr:YtxH domain-containing protein [Chloroflexota bacterium]
MNQRVYYSQEAEQQARREQALLMMLFLGIGASVGAILALLFAPSSGSDTRQDIASLVEDSMNQGRDATNSAFQQIEAQISDLYKKIEDRLK